MFTGIVEAMATLEKKQINQSNIDFIKMFIEAA